MYNGLTFLRGIAAFFIVGCHLQLAPRTLIGEQITHFCNMNVGLFGAISGFLLANTIYKNPDFMFCQYAKRRIGRLFPIYSVWSLFYIGASFLFAILLKGGIPVDKYLSVSFWYSVVFWGGASCHLWFIASLLYIQLAVAFIWGIRRTFMNNITVFLVAVLLVYLSSFSRNFYLLYPCRLFGFVLLGMFVYGVAQKREVALGVAVFLTIVGSLIHCMCGNFLHAFLRDFILVGAAMLLFARSTMPLIGGKVAEVMAKHSLGVFLIHPFFAAGIAVVFNRLFSAPYAGGVVLGEWLLIYAISFATTVVLMRFSGLLRFLQ